MKKFYARTIIPMSLLIALLITGNTVFSQSTGDNPLFRHLPPDAERVYHINLPGLLSKVDLDNALMPLAMASKGSIKDILQDPTLTGVDLQKDIFFTQHGTSLGKDPVYTTILVHLSDSGKFVSLIAKSDKGFHRVHLAGKEAVAAIGNTGFAWNSQLAVITMIKAPKDSNAIVLSVPVSYSTLAVQKSLASLKGYENSPFTTNPFFKAGFSDDADFHFWGPQGSFIALLSELAKNKFPGNTQAVEQAMHKMNLKTIIALRFDAGKVVITSKMPFPTDTAAIYAATLKHPFNPDMLARIPGGPLLALMTVNYDFSAMGAYFDKFKVAEKMDSILGKAGMKFNDILQSFKGDFLFAAVAPAGTQEETGSTSSGSPTIPDLYFITTIGNRASFDKLTGQLHLLDTTGASPLDKIKAHYTLQDNILVIGRSKALTNGFFSATSHRSTDLVTPAMARNPYNIVFDCKAIATYVRGMSIGSSAKAQQILHILDAFDKLSFSMGAMDGNVMSSVFELKMADASTNSLKALFNIFH